VTASEGSVSPWKPFRYNDDFSVNQKKEIVMVTARASITRISCWRLIGLILAAALLFVSIQNQEAYAERKMENTLNQIKGTKKTPVGGSDIIMTKVK
jgi:hypothetical protein